MPYYSRIILNSIYNQLFPKLFRHNRRMPSHTLLDFSETLATLNTMHTLQVQ